MLLGHDVVQYNTLSVWVPDTVPRSERKQNSSLDNDYRAWRCIMCGVYS